MASGRRSNPSCNSPDSAAAMSHWFFASLRGYRIGWLPRDLVAGLMLAAIAIPGQLATARLAGMPPETGSMPSPPARSPSPPSAPTGSCRSRPIRPSRRSSPAAWHRSPCAGPMPYAQLATLLALMVGVVLVAVGLLRAGWLATLLSIPVTTGFLAGISVHIIVGELPTLLGIPDEQGHFLLRLVHILGRLGEAMSNAGDRRRCPGRDHGHVAHQPPDPGGADRPGRGGARRGPVPSRRPRRRLLGALSVSCRSSPCRPSPIPKHSAGWCRWPWWSPWSASCRRQRWPAPSRPTPRSPTMSAATLPASAPAASWPA